MLSFIILFIALIVGFALIYFAIKGYQSLTHDNFEDDEFLEK